MLASALIKAEWIIRRGGLDERTKKRIKRAHILQTSDVGLASLNGKGGGGGVVVTAKKGATAVLEERIC